MIVLSFLFLTLVLAGLTLRLTWRSLSINPGVSWLRLVLALSLAAFVYLYGAWIYLSAYAKYAFLLLVLFTGILSFVRNRKRKATVPKRSILHISLSVVLLTMVVLYFTGTAGPTPYALLRFPLKPGRYFVLQGGKGLPANVFHFNSRRAVYAMDIVKLDQWGRRSTRVISTRLHDYYIFGDTIYSPCDGTVQRAVSDNPDNIPPKRERGPNNLNGVVLAGNDYTVYLGHMQQDRVFVAAGQTVTAGQPLGLAGNSGMSLEPHLHIQVHAKSTDGSPWYTQPQLFIKFDNKEYLLFEEIDATQMGR